MNQCGRLISTVDAHYKRGE